MTDNIVAIVNRVGDRHRQARLHLYKMATSVAVGAALLESDDGKTRREVAGELRQVERFLDLLYDSLWSHEECVRDRIIDEHLRRSEG